MRHLLWLMLLLICPAKQCLATEETVFDAYQVGPFLYEHLIADIATMSLDELFTTLQDNSRSVEITDYDGPDGSTLRISHSTLGDHSHIRTLPFPKFGPAGLLPHELYEPAGLKAAILLAMGQDGFHARLPEGTIDRLVEIFMKGPDEGLAIAESLRDGKIKHAQGKIFALFWMAKVAVQSGDLATGGRAAAWILDPKYRKEREKESDGLATRMEELATANKVITMIQGKSAMKRRDLLYCLLKSNDTHPNPKALEELKYITLSRMADWGEPYPKADFEKISSRLGFWRRIAIKYWYWGNETPVWEGDLPLTDMNIYRCPFLTPESFR